MTKAQKTEMEEARADLRNRLKPGQEILCVLRSVSRSGMQRVIDLKVIEDGELRGLGWTAATAMGETFDPKREGIKTTGCGMDMGFHTVYSLSRVLWLERALLDFGRSKRPSKPGYWVTARGVELVIREMEHTHLLNTIAWVERQVRRLQDTFCDAALDVDRLYPEHVELVAEARRRKLIQKTKKVMVSE